MSLGAGLACSVNVDDPDDDDTDSDTSDIDGASEADIEATCQAYCTKAKECDDEVTVTTCVTDCREDMGDCQADEQSQALDDLDMCAAESCDDFTGCTIGAGLQCTFGI